MTLSVNQLQRTIKMKKKSKFALVDGVNQAKWSEGITCCVYVAMIMIFSYQKLIISGSYWLIIDLYTENDI